jgi:hypothetical protein
VGDSFERYQGVEGKDPIILPLNLEVLSSEQRYWDSSSCNELGTPKYLHLYNNNAHVSLAISEEDAETNQPEQTSYDCPCLLFQRASPKPSPS